MSIEAEDFIRVPIKYATRTPTESDRWQLYVHRFWMVTEENDILFYKEFNSPQCNVSRQYIESCCKDEEFPIKTRAVQLERVWVRYRPSASLTPIQQEETL